MGRRRPLGQEDARGRLSGCPRIAWAFVILSEAKNLRKPGEILRFAQDDSFQTQKLFLGTR
jgi:hypothetical protein